MKSCKTNTLAQSEVEPEEESEVEQDDRPTESRARPAKSNQLELVTRSAPGKIIDLSLVIYKIIKYFQLVNDQCPQSAVNG